MMCGVWSAVCKMWSAQCGVWSVKCKVQIVECGLRMWNVTVHHCAVWDWEVWGVKCGWECAMFHGFM